MATLYAYSPNGTQATLSYSVIGFTQSLQQNGWCKLPNGLILQWGNKSTTSAITTTKFKYPISLKDTPLLALSAAIDSDNWNGQAVLWHSLRNITNTQLSVASSTFNSWYISKSVGYLVMGI